MRWRVNGRRTLFIYVCAILLALWTLVPVYWLLNLSFMFNVEMIATPDALLSARFHAARTISASSIKRSPGPMGRSCCRFRTAISSAGACSTA